MGEFHSFIAGHSRWGLELINFHHSQAQDVLINPRQPGQAPTFHHRIDALIKLRLGLSHSLGPQQGPMAQILLISQLQQARVFQAGRKSVENLL